MKKQSQFEAIVPVPKTGPDSLLSEVEVQTSNPQKLGFDASARPSLVEWPAAIRGLGTKRAFPVDVLWCSNARRGRSNGWSFPPAVRKQIVADSQGCRILQLFGGRSTFGTRMDVDPIVAPDVIADAWLPPFACNSFDVVVLDPPYFHLNAQVKTALFRAAGWIARERVIWFSTVWASNCAALRCERAFLVRVGDSCHVRCLQYFAVTHPKPGPVKRFTRGPAMRYNRWLSQPASLDLQLSTSDGAAAPERQQTKKELSS